jgi:N-acetylglucosaminyl-diphospho-decaprenol L-rhamnosyltransferase
MSEVAVDAVVVTRDTRELTLRCVRSALVSEPGLRIACTVVDNASSDGTAEAIEQELPAVQVIRNDHNAAYGRACNQGAAGGNGAYVLILNSDIVARPGAVARLVDFLETHPEHVAAGGRVVDPGTDAVQVGHAVRAFPTLPSQAAQMLGLERKWPSNPLSRRALGLDLDYERTQDVDQPPGSCLLCRRTDFDAVGGFDEHFFYWYEDVDLCRRLRDRGRIAYVHDAPFEHEGGATFAGWSSPQRVTSWYSGVLRYFAKHRPGAEQLAIRALCASLASLRALAWLPRDRERSRALWGVARLAARPASAQGAASPL